MSRVSTWTSCASSSSAVVLSDVVVNSDHDARCAAGGCPKASKGGRGCCVIPGRPGMTRARPLVLLLWLAPLACADRMRHRPVSGDPLPLPNPVPHPTPHRRGWRAGARAHVRGGVPGRPDRLHLGAPGRAHPPRRRHRPHPRQPRRLAHRPADDVQHLLQPAGRVRGGGDGGGAEGGLRGRGGLAALVLRRRERQLPRRRRDPPHAQGAAPQQNRPPPFPVCSAL